MSVTWVACCQVEVPATVLSFVQTSPADYGVCVCARARSRHLYS
jgi:hypothetical protein